MAWRVTVDRGRCMGSGICTALAPGLFRMDGERSHGPDGECAPDESLVDAADSCPAGAITVVEDGRVIGPSD